MFSAVGKKYAPDMEKPVMRIGAVAELLGVTEQMVRIYEARGLVSPARRNNQRLYSLKDVYWLARIRELVHEEGYDLEEIERMIALPACWKLLNCSEEDRANCELGRCPGVRKVKKGHKSPPDPKCRSCQVFLIATAAEAPDQDEPR